MRISSVVMSPDDYDKYMEQFQAGMEKYQEGMEKYRSAMEKAQGSLEKAQGALSGLSDGNGHSYSFSTSSKTNANSWMQKLLFYVEKLQDDGSAHYIYLSKLYELCKDTEGLDQMDLKIAMQQLASVYKQLKEKKKLKESELLFLESMVDLLENKTK
jgi:flagellar biosynthesis chaperone FliJ